MPEPWSRPGLVAVAAGDAGPGGRIKGAVAVAAARCPARGVACCFNRGRRSPGRRGQSLAADVTSAPARARPSLGLVRPWRLKNAAPRVDACRVAPVPSAVVCRPSERRARVKG
jgi:hypothetical protein